MFALKFFTFMALACLALGSDLEIGYEIMSCANRAITNGVRDLHIPSHFPALHQVHNITFSNEAYGVQFDFNLTNAVWAGIPLWKVNATQLSQDSDDYAVLNFTLRWDWFNIIGQYGLNTSVGLFGLGKNFSGAFELDIRDIMWEGQLNFTKHSDTNNLNATCNAADIWWSLSVQKSSLNGFGIFDEEIETAVGAEIEHLLNDRIVNIGNFIRGKINLWWDNGRIYDLIDWCKANPVNSTTF